MAWDHIVIGGGGAYGEQVPLQEVALNKDMSNTDFIRFLRALNPTEFCEANDSSSDRKLLDCTHTHKGRYYTVI
jgi:hypothetical protein